MNTKLLASDPISSIGRRHALFGGAVLALAPLASAALVPGIEALPGGSRPTYVPAADTRDAAAHGIAEALFWNEQMKEHATFFIMLMPGDALAEVRTQAQQFERSFAGLLERAHGANANNHAEVLAASVDATRDFVAYKHRLQEQQSSGRLQSLVWPTFFEHTAREGEYFMKRLESIMRGETVIDREEATRFWLMIMGEHAGFIAHLLDPRERKLVDKAMKLQHALLHHGSRVNGERALDAVEDILDFKVAAQKGIETGAIESIIAPALADHVRREAVKAANELRRAA